VTGALSDMILFFKRTYKHAKYENTTKEAFDLNQVFTVAS
jgi:hypothetical protein